MQPAERLKQMKAYREVAMQEPKSNKLYIEDLNQSIEYFETVVKQGKMPIEIKNGFAIDT